MESNLKKTPLHWIDKLTSDLIANWPEIQAYNCNSGISVSGQQHVGRLRGEIVLTNAVVNELRTRGLDANHSLILYTADPGCSRRYAERSHHDRFNCWLSR